MYNGGHMDNVESWADCFCSRQVEQADKAEKAFSQLIKLCTKPGTSLAPAWHQSYLGVGLLAPYPQTEIQAQK